MPELISAIENNIESRHLLKRGQRILVAVSGGVDSMVLLNLLFRLRKQWNWQLTVAHLNHQLRAEESDADQRLVRAAAKRYRLPFVTTRADVRQIARREGLSIEMAARKARHEFLASAARKRGIRAIALAHHADDQVELFFLRLFRGAGSEGLSGMKWRNPSPIRDEIELIRPLLDIPKAALEDYASKNGVRFREDATNRSLDIQRNRIRHELLPLIRESYQGAVQSAVSRAAEIISAETEYAAEVARYWLKSRKIGFDQLAVAVQRHAVRLQLLELGISPQFELVEHLRLRPNQATSVGNRGELSRDIEGNVQWSLIRDAAFMPGSKSVKLGSSRTGEIDFGGAAIKWTIKARKTAKLPQFRAGREYFDADRVGREVFLRHWRPGDRFQPIGMSQPVKLQNLLVNLKIPRDARRELIVATTATGEIFWVEKLRISERFKLYSRTKRHLQWDWRRS